MSLRESAYPALAKKGRSYLTTFVQYGYLFIPKAAQVLIWWSWIWHSLDFMLHISELLHLRYLPFLLLISKICKKHSEILPSLSKSNLLGSSLYVKQSFNFSLVATWAFLDPALPKAHLSKKDLKMKVGLWWRRCHFSPWSCSLLKHIKDRLSFGLLSGLNKLIKLLLDFHLARNPHVYIPPARALVWKRKEY